MSDNQSDGAPAKSAPWPGFERGMGIGGWLTNYKRFNVLPADQHMDITIGDLEHFDSYITEGDVQRIGRWGFDHIRVAFDQIVMEETPYVYRERTFRRLDAFIGWCAKYGLNVVLNLHKAIGNYCDIAEDKGLLDDEELQNRVIALWSEIERRYHDHPGIAFELLNEVRNVDPEKWNDCADRMIRAIREKNPTRPIVVGATCWNDSYQMCKSLRVWDDPNVIYTFHMYVPFEFTHQRGVLQAGPHHYNRDLDFPTSDVARYRGFHELYGNKNSYPDVTRIDQDVLERAMWGAMKFVSDHPDKVCWLGEFGTIRHINPPSRVAYMKAVIGFCKKHGIPYSVWNYLSTPNDGNRFSLVDDVTRDFLSDELQKACLGIGDRAESGELKFMAFNIWGPYFGNPVCERERKLVSYIKRNEPDILALQEAEHSFYESLFFTMLGSEYDIIRDSSDPAREHNPLLYRRDRLELIEGKTEVFAAASNPQGSKGFTWGVFRDKATGRKFISYSTHLMWSSPQFPRTVTAHMRVENAREIFSKLGELKARYGELPVIGGGDLNTTVNDMEAGLETPLSDWQTAGFADAQYSVAGASQWSSNHGDPVRDSLGNLRACFMRGSDDPKNSLDHVHYEPKGVAPLSLLVDRDQDALETSDHSPVVFGFTLK